ncbi:hypothetical protein ACJED5_000774 [Campylobacter jejuni]
MNLILENPSEKLIKAIKAMAKIENTKVKLKKKKRNLLLMALRLNLKKRF